MNLVAVTLEDPFRLRFLMGLTEALKEITPANGYYSDVGGRVVRGKRFIDVNDPVPMVSILEVPIQEEETFRQIDRTSVINTWTLMVQGFSDDEPVQDGFGGETDKAQLLLADIQKCLVRQSLRKKNNGEDRDPFGFGNRIDEVRIAVGTCQPADFTSDKAFCYVGLRLKVVEYLDAPEK